MWLDHLGRWPLRGECIIRQRSSFRDAQRDGFDLRAHRCGSHATSMVEQAGNSFVEELGIDSVPSRRVAHVLQKHWF